MLCGKQNSTRSGAIVWCVPREKQRMEHHVMHILGICLWWGVVELQCRHKYLTQINANIQHSQYLDHDFVPSRASFWILKSWHHFLSCDGLFATFCVNIWGTVASDPRDRCQLVSIALTQKMSLMLCLHREGTVTPRWCVWKHPPWLKGIQPHQFCQCGSRLWELSVVPSIVSNFGRPWIYHYEPSRIQDKERLRNQLVSGVSGTGSNLWKIPINNFGE